MAGIPTASPIVPPPPAPKITGLETPMVVLAPQYCLPYDVELVVTEKAISIDDASAAVKDSNGNIVLKLKGRWLGIHEKRWLCDPSGVPLITMQDKKRTAHGRWHMYRGDSTDSSNLICTLKTPNPKIIQFRPEYHIFLAANTSEENCDFKVKKGYNRQQMTFYLGNTDKVIAQMHVRKNIKTRILEQDSYGLTIHTNMDYAFIVALTSILDATRDASGS
jgi:uncharacterized protein YxjI